jgi:hypothetical protein
MRNLPKAFQDAFDAVVCCDDPLAHLLGSGELRIAFLGMRTALRQGGLLLLSSRDYDRLIVERPREPPGHGGGQQLWEWDAGEPTYVRTQTVKKRGAVGTRTVRVSTRARAHTRGEISEELEAAGFTRFSWHEDSGYFETVVSAVSPS